HLGDHCCQHARPAVDQLVDLADHDDRRPPMTGLVLPQQHIGVIWAEWEKIGKPMPFAVVQGGDPGVPMIGGMPIPADVDEGSFLGTLYGEPVEVVKCE